MIHEEIQCLQRGGLLQHCVNSNWLNASFTIPVPQASVAPGFTLVRSRLTPHDESTPSGSPSVWQRRTGAAQVRTGPDATRSTNGCAPSAISRVILWVMVHCGTCSSVLQSGCYAGRAVRQDCGALSCRAKLYDITNTTEALCNGAASRHGLREQI